jgi:Mrp family chromosome partitioning ATPase
VSAAPVRHPSFPFNPAFRPSHPQDDPSASNALETRRAQSLVARTVLKGCREAIQRIGEPDPRTYGVTSSIRGEGRSTVATGMALVEWLDYGRRTVLVDLDLDQPTLHRRLGLAVGPGVGDLAASSAAVEDHLQRIVGDVWLLSAGHQAEESPRILNRLAQGSVISQLIEWADAVIFDLPPILASPTGLEAARLCGNPVLVVRAGVTPMPTVKRASEALAEAPPVVLNGVRSALPRWIQRATGDWHP